MITFKPNAEAMRYTLLCVYIKYDGNVSILFSDFYGRASLRTPLHSYIWKSSEDVMNATDFLELKFEDVSISTKFIWEESRNRIPVYPQNS